MESMESIRAEQPAINHMMIGYAELAFMYIRQQAVIRGRVCVVTRAKEGRTGRRRKNSRCRPKRKINEVSEGQIYAQKSARPATDGVAVSQAETTPPASFTSQDATRPVYLIGHTPASSRLIRLPASISILACSRLFYLKSFSFKNISEELSWTTGLTLMLDIEDVSDCMSAPLGDGGRGRLMRHDLIKDSW